MRLFGILFLLFSNISIGLCQHNSNNSSDTLIIDSLLKECSDLEFTNPDSAWKLTDKIITYSENINYKKGLGMAFLQKAYLKDDTGEYEEATKLYNDAINIFEAINDTKRVAVAKNSLGILLNYQGNYHEALLNLQDAYEIHSGNNNKKGGAIVLGNIGLVHQNNNNYNEALEYYQKSLDLKTELNDSLGIAISEMNIGNIYFFKNDYEKSLEHYFTSVDISKKINDKTGIALCLIAIGNVHIEQKNYTLAEENFLYAEDILKSINTKNGLAECLQGLGITYYNQNKLKKAIETLEEGLRISNELDLKPITSEFYKNLADAYKALNDYKKALFYFQLHSQLKDSIFNIEKNKQIVELEAKHQTKIKEQELSENKEELIQKNAELTDIKNEDSLLKVIFTIIISSVLSISIFIFLNYRKKKKLADELEKLSIVAREIENTVIIADKDGQIEWINESYTRKNGFGLEGFHEKWGKHLFNESDNPEILDIIRNCQKNKKPVKYTLELKDKNGVKNWVQTTMTPILDNNSEIKNFVLIDADITDVKLAEEKVAQQRDELAYKNNLITESIDYAKRIQSALLPSKKRMERYFSEHFIFYQPKDIVSGDFYWIDSTEDQILFAAADCTGHGVPGALLSVIGMNALNSIYNKGIFQPKEILKALSEKLKKTLLHSDSDDQLKDGIDIAVCSFIPNKKGNSLGLLRFSGAHIPVYIARNGEIIEFKGDKIHIDSNNNHNKEFTLHETEILDKDVIYLFSDGFPDQKGGPDGKKFYYQPFRQLLSEIAHLPMTEQKNILDQTINEWMKNQPQLDDILIMGIKF